MAEHVTSRKPRLWPDDSPLSGASMARVDTTVSCILTRFHLRSRLFLLPFYLSFCRVRRASRQISGLLQVVFLIEDLRTCYTLSIWKDDIAIVEFGNIKEHIAAANAAFGATIGKGSARPEIWSAQFRLWAVSCHNLEWKGFDVPTMLSQQQCEIREKLAKGLIRAEDAYAR